MSGCQYCGGTETSPWRSGVRDRLRFASGTWTFVRCMTCGSARLDPFPRAEELGSFYPPVYGVEPPASPRGFKGFLASLPHRLFYQPLLDAQYRLVLQGTGLRSRNGLRLLDVGCGRGLRLPAFQRSGFHVVGMDFTPTYLETLRTSGIPAFCSDFEHLHENIPPASFDVVTAFHVFEHAADLRTAAEACRFALRAGGWLVVAVPLADSWQARILGHRWIGVTEAPRHVTLPTHEGMTHLLTANGFEVTRFCPDAVLNTAGMLALSLLPSAALTNRNRGGMLSRFISVTSMITTIFGIPWTAIENALLGRPGAGLFFARRVR